MIDTKPSPPAQGAVESSIEYPPKMHNTKEGCCGTPYKM